MGLSGLTPLVPDGWTDRGVLREHGQQNRNRPGYTYCTAADGRPTSRRTPRHRRLGTLTLKLPPKSSAPHDLRLLLLHDDLSLNHGLQGRLLSFQLRVLTPLIVLVVFGPGTSRRLRSQGETPNNRRGKSSVPKQRRKNPRLTPCVRGRPSPVSYFLDSPSSRSSAEERDGNPPRSCFDCN